MRNGLFRQEALQRQDSPVLGDVRLITPPSAMFWIMFAATIGVLLIAFAVWGEYTRKAHVTGYLAPDKGLIKVLPPLAGTLIEKRVKEGQEVKQGDVLFVLSTDRSTPVIANTQAATLRQLDQRRSSYESERTMQHDIDRLQQSGLKARIEAAGNEIALIDDALKTREKRLESAEQTATRFSELAHDHYVPAVQAQQKYEELLEQRAQLQEMQRQRANLIQQRATLNVELESSALRANVQRTETQRNLALLEQERVGMESQRLVIVTAPADGQVTTIVAEQGQYALPTTPLLTILPSGASLQAQLLVPSRAMGFIAAQQTVALRYQAFPYQHFGNHQGRVVEISKTLLAPNETTLPVAEPVYRITVALDQQTIHAQDKDLPLQAGMLLDADVWLERRSILQWIFAPLYTLSGTV